MTRVLMFVLPLVVTIYALVDCIQTEDEKVRHIAKAWWILLIVLVPFAGPVAWLVAGRRRGPGRPRASRAGPGPIAPDDDPDFLRRLEDEARRKRREKRDEGPSTGPAET